MLWWGRPRECTQKASYDGGGEQEPLGTGDRLAGLELRGFPQREDWCEVQGCAEEGSEHGSIRMGAGAAPATLQRVSNSELLYGDTVGLGEELGATDDQPGPKMTALWGTSQESVY